MAEITLDVRRMLCPMPVIKLQNRAKTAQQGDIITVVVTDPGAQFDIPAWCDINKYTVIDIAEDTQSHEWKIRVLLDSPAP